MNIAAIGLGEMSLLGHANRGGTANTQNQGQHTEPRPTQINASSSVPQAFHTALPVLCTCVSQSASSDLRHPCIPPYPSRPATYPSPLPHARPLLTSLPFSWLSASSFCVLLLLVSSCSTCSSSDSSS